MDSSIEVSYNFVGYNNNMGSRTSGNFPKRNSEDGDVRISTTEECDSTTGPANPKVQFVVGDDVLYQEETGQNVLGTVALVQGKKVKIIFMDETEKWAHISKVKKLVADNEESKQNGTADAVASTECQSNDGGAVSSASKKKSKGDINGQGVQRENLPVICGSCGIQKTITSKKAAEYSPFTQHQYNCRKCINKSKTNKNNGMPLPLAAHYLAQAVRGRPKGSGSDNGNTALVKGILDQGKPNGMLRQENNCLHCRGQIMEKFYLKCTMCERPCHSHCLPLTPNPLPGDMFWSIICEICGTQKPDGSLENDSHKLYSSRRNISSWSDVAYLLLSCLGCKFSDAKFFDLDQHLIPFWEENLSSLHLPRQYKTAEPLERRRLLLLALKNANLRFVNDDERKANPLWAIKDHTNKGLNSVVTIKPPVTGGGRAVTAAGFPISVRTSNPEAASVAMTNIAQTIAANKVINVPTPKNSPSLVPQKTNSVIKTGGAGTLGMLARKVPKAPDHLPVAKKTGSELNSGMQQRSKYNNELWQQSRFQKTTFSPDLPKTTNNVGHNRGVEEGSSVPSNTNPNSSTTNGNRIQMSAQSSYKQSTTLSASPGGAARVSGMVLSPTSGAASTEIINKVNCGSYPVRKTGSPMLNRSIRLEPVERKKDGEAHQQSYRYDEGGRRIEPELIRESPGFNNASQPKISLKRKLSIGKPTETTNTSFSRVLEGQSALSEAKKLKMSLPTSTDVTSQRVPSPTKPPDSDSPPRKKAMSPLQKLSDLQKNGGLTVACLTHTESGVQTVAINASALEDSKLANGKESTSIDVLRLSPERYEALLTTPVKNSNGATAAKDGGTPVITLTETEDNTKDNNVTTSPRAFKLASVSSPGTSTKSSPINERRMARPVRLKRAVVANAQSEKQSKDSSELTGKTNKKMNVKGNNAAAAALVAKASRGRPKKPFKYQLRKPMGMAYNVGQFNGPVQNEESSETAAGQTINEMDYSWKNSTINDLLQYGQGYRLECLPKCPDKKEELVSQAIGYFKEEVTPRPPSYWSTSSNHSKKPTNLKSLKDLKNVDSYYISGRRIGADGIKYQVVWRDGYGYEYSSEDEEELEVGLGEENYMYFEDYDPDEWFKDKMPVTVNSLTGNCDNKSPGSDHSSDRMDTEEGTEGRLCFSNKANIHSSDVSGVKREPVDSSAENSPVKALIPASKSAEADEDPVIIDLTDSP